MIFIIVQLLETVLVEYLVLVGQITVGERDNLPDITFKFEDPIYKNLTFIILCIKFVLFYAFMLYQCFELELMCTFILTQSSVFLE